MIRAARAHIALLVALLGAAMACAAPAGAQQPAGLAVAPAPVMGSVVAVDGTLPAAAGQRVALQRLVPRHGWRAAGSAVAAADGSFHVDWRPVAVGPTSLRAIVAGRAAEAAQAPPMAQVNVLRPVRATWYGPGLFGNRTACGQQLVPEIMGVAHRTLPCGTPVEIWLAGRSIVVPVIDRGPYAHGAHYDLTAAAARALGMTATTTIAVSPRRGQTMAPPFAAPDPAAAAGGVAPPPPA